MSRRPKDAEKEAPRKRARGDTFAWLCAAFQVITPVLLALIVMVLLAYGLIHLLFLR